MRPLPVIVALLAVVSCSRQASPAPVADPAPASTPHFSLPALKKSHPTKLIKQVRDQDPPPPPPAKVFDLVHYPAPLGSNLAYVTPIAPGGVRRPGIVWIAGGFTWGIDEGAWEPAERTNDQSARAFREAGIVLMRPALRGASGNPGQFEGFFGEVEDVLAAADFLAKRPDVDPKRIYLGGHSTGGTMALLAAESTDRFRAIFAFGPIAHVLHYGRDWGPYDASNNVESNLRSPLTFINDIVTPTFVIEGQLGGNAQSIALLQKKVVAGTHVHFLLVPGASHFSQLASSTEVVARKILADDGPSSNISLTVDELEGAFLAPAPK